MTELKPGWFASQAAAMIQHALRDHGPRRIREIAAHGYKPVEGNELCHELRIALQDEAKRVEATL